MNAPFGEGGPGTGAILNIDFLRAPCFTLTFRLTTLALVIGVGPPIAPPSRC